MTLAFGNYLIIYLICYRSYFYQFHSINISLLDIGTKFVTAKKLYDLEKYNLLPFLSKRQVNEDDAQSCVPTADD